MTTDKNNDILISIVIVNYKVPYCLVEALRSLRLAELYDRSETIIVDNASGDCSCELITSQFEEVHWIQLKTNIGFGKACNIGVNAARGKYLLLLNPDTIISADTLSKAVEFMETHPKAGLMGPKILNPDGTLQLSCRRSIPTPSTAFYYFAGLSHIFPRSKRFGRYHLTYMDEDEAAQVDVISGSFMFMKRDLFCEIEGFDKRFFMYGEDIDLCYRISRAGYEVWYYPAVKIVHQKGKSSSKRRIRSRFYFYEAMIIFSRKYRNVQETYFPWWLMWGGIVFQAAFNIGATLMHSAMAVLIDLAMINAAMWAGLSQFSARLGYPPQYSGFPTAPLLSMHAFASFILVAMFLYNGIYSAKQYTLKNIFLSGILGSAIFMSWIYFMTDYCLTAFGAAMGMAIPSAILWREALPLAVRGIKSCIFAPGKALVIGRDDDTARYLRSADARKSVRIVGVIRLGGAESPGQVEGYPVLGKIGDLDDTIKQRSGRDKIDSLVITSAQPWYSEIINVLAKHRNNGVDIRWEAMEF